MFKNISQEVVDKIGSNTRFAIPGQLFILAGVVYILKDYFDGIILLSGIAIHILLIFSRFVIKKLFIDKPKIFLNIYIISTTLSGIAWGVILFFMNDLGAEYHLLIFTILVGLVAGALFTLGEILELYLSYTMPILGMSIFWFFTHTDNEMYRLVAYLSLSATFYYFLAAKKYNQSFNDALYEKNQNEALLKEIKEKSKEFEFLFEHSVNGALIIEDGKFVQCNQKSVEMVGYDSKEELLNIYPSDISPQYQSDGRLSSEKVDEMIKIAFENGSNIFEWLHTKKDGKIFLAEVNLSSVVINGKKVLYTSWRDITEENRYKNDLKHLAHHDTLTALPNRMLFNDRLEQAIVKSTRSDLQLAVFFIDLDKFKPINDTLGHEIGDKVLIKISSLLRKSLRREDTLARIGGDEFTVIMENVSNIKDISMIASKLLYALDAPIMIDSHSLDLSLSIGISIFPDDASDSKTLLKLADEAMYDAKDNGRNTFSFYNKDL